jgi:hypothetical protein
MEPNSDIGKVKKGASAQEMDERSAELIEQSAASGGIRSWIGRLQAAAGRDNF